MFHFISAKILNVLIGRTDGSFINEIERDADVHILACLLLIAVIVSTIGWIA